MTKNSAPVKTSFGLPFFLIGLREPLLISVAHLFLCHLVFRNNSRAAKRTSPAFAMELAMEWQEGNRAQGGKTGDPLTKTACLSELNERCFLQPRYFAVVNSDSGVPHCAFSFPRQAFYAFSECLV